MIGAVSDGKLAGGLPSGATTKECCVVEVGL